MWSFFWFPVWFQAFLFKFKSSSVYILYRTASAFNWSEATQAEAFDRSKVFDRI